MTTTFRVVVVQRMDSFKLLILLNESATVPISDFSIFFPQMSIFKEISCLTHARILDHLGDDAKA